MESQASREVGILVTRVSKGAPDVRTDKLVLLTSSDWFLPYWGHIGFWFSEHSRSSIQRHARACVTELVGTAHEYWSVVMSEERIRNTKDRFFVAAGEDQEARRDRRRMQVICDQVLFAASQRNATGLWLFDLISDELLQGRMEPLGLDAKLIAAVEQSRAAARSMEQRVDFDDVSLGSSTA